MAEALVAAPEQAFQIPDQFRKIPFCDPDMPANSSLDMLLTFRPSEIAADPEFKQHLFNRYEELKTADSGSSDEPGLDLTNPKHAFGMAWHTLIHASAGLIDAGVSDSRCIPYWDRASTEEAFSRLNPEGARQQLEMFDVLSINTLRAYCSYLITKVDSHEQSIELITMAMGKGQRSMSDMQPLRESRLVCNARESDEYADLYIAKLKHLLWLVDQQQNPAIRQCLAREIRGYVDYAVDKRGFPVEELVLNMGTDTGISASSYRPPYDISAFVQLAHLRTPGAERHTYSLPQRICHRVSIGKLLISIDRKGWNLPAYEDGRYEMPWDFSNSN